MSLWNETKQEREEAREVRHKLESEEFEFV
ncbi:MAG: hypothetical protein JWL89_154 [Candidatus Saccharibacteria bacterium]|nr:hypothetical protein [Candidatus Saccharibacteria bacterium]